uniref:Galactose mutarotase n=1 Tax=Timema californicum TaxID=61474 RepID=A0A7R9PCS1_TIMCA|nr:unnamed protein product [Timema californicum]
MRASPLSLSSFVEFVRYGLNSFRDEKEVGDIVPVDNTPFDLRNSTILGEGIKAVSKFDDKGGYDHNFCIINSCDEDLTFVARVEHPISGIALEVHADQPGVQFYTGNGLSNATVGKGSTPYSKHGAFCLETQNYPDAVNHGDSEYEGDSEYDGDSEYECDSEYDGDSEYEGDSEYDGDSEYEGDSEYDGDSEYEGESEYEGDSEYDGDSEYSDTPMDYWAVQGSLGIYLSQYGPDLTRAFYSKMNIEAFMRRMLMCRCKYAYGQEERLESADDARGREFSRYSATQNESMYYLRNYEVVLSGLIGASSLTKFINGGERKDMGIPRRDGNIVQEGAIVGLVGPNLRYSGKGDGLYCGLEDAEGVFK